MAVKISFIKLLIIRHSLLIIRYSIVKIRTASNMFIPNKRYGQNFLTDKNLLAAIAADAGVGANDTVVEVGAGAGALTAQLAVRAKRVIAYEIDNRLEDILAVNLVEHDNIEIIWGDVLKLDPTKGFEPYSYIVAANLPYYITTPILFHFLESANPPRSMTVMVQEEVADRMVALPGSPGYGALTAAIGLRGTAKVTRKVGRNLFSPPPNVDSAVVRIDLKPSPTDVDYTAVAKIIRAAFAMRRKTLVNNLQALGYSRQKATAAVEGCGLPITVRGERLNITDFVKLTKEITNCSVQITNKDK